MANSISRYLRGERYCRECSDWHKLKELERDASGALVCPKSRRRVKNKPIDKPMSYVPKISVVKTETDFQP